MELVLASLFGLVPLKKNHSAALVARSEVVARLVEFDGRYDVGFRNVFDIAFVAEASVRATVSNSFLSVEDRQAYENVALCEMPSPCRSSGRVAVVGTTTSAGALPFTNGIRSPIHVGRSLVPGPNVVDIQRTECLHHRRILFGLCEGTRLLVLPVDTIGTITDGVLDGDKHVEVVMRFGLRVRDGVVTVGPGIQSMAERSGSAAALAARNRKALTE